MPKTGYEAFEALDPFFDVVMKGLQGLVDGKHPLTQWTRLRAFAQVLDTSHRKVL